jgi:hypothetical protein
MNAEKLKAALSPWAEKLPALVQLYLYGDPAKADAPLDIAVEILSDMEWPEQDTLWKANAPAWEQQVAQACGRKAKLVLFQGTKTQALMDTLQANSSIFFP